MISAPVATRRKRSSGGYSEWLRGLLNVVSLEMWDRTTGSVRQSMAKIHFISVNCNLQNMLFTFALPLLWLLSLSHKIIEVHVLTALKNNPFCVVNLCKICNSLKWQLL